MILMDNYKGEQFSIAATRVHMPPIYQIFDVRMSAERYDLIAVRSQLLDPQAEFVTDVQNRQVRFAGYFSEKRFCRFLQHMISQTCFLMCVIALTVRGESCVSGLSSM